MRSIVLALVLVVAYIALSVIWGSAWAIWQANHGDRPTQHQHR